MNEVFLDLELLSVLEEKILSKMYQSARCWICSECGKEGKKNDIYRHVESKHISDHPGYSCNYCGETVKSSNALRLHLSIKHKPQSERFTNDLHS